jgi:hypothetical protein
MMTEESELQGIVDDANRRIVRNVLNSYAGFYDVFSEMIQNSLDALQLQAREAGANYTPQLWITIDIRNRRVRVVDNGTGMDEAQFKYCLRPNVSFKRGVSLRGHKGVGATYLAYGFSMLKLQSRRNGVRTSAVLRGGRNWAEDESGTVPRPRFEQQPYEVSELASEVSGTSIEVIIGDSPGERPRDLGWIGARNAEQWLNVMRIKTPLGGVYLTTPVFKPRVSIIVVDQEGTETRTETNSCEYFYPHEFPSKVKALSDITKALDEIRGDPSTKFARLSAEYKKLECVYEIWTKDALLSEDSIFASSISEEGRQLIERHNVAVYGAFLSSAKQWGEFNDEVLRLRKGTRLLHGGLQLASDGMVQGDLAVIPLTSTIGYQANSHVIVHFTDGNPDMGRKVFQPELKALAELLAVRAVNVFKRHLQHMRPDTGATSIPPSRALHEWKKAQEQHRDKNPLSLCFDGRQLALVSTPQQEQDVIALFHELIGAGVIKGIKIFSTSQNETYDSLIELDYDSKEHFRYDKKGNPLGVNGDLPFPYSSEPQVLEYKYDFDSLISDFAKEIKFPQHINLVVCWTASGNYKERFYLNSLLIGEEGSDRTVFGATHQAYSDGSEKRFEVVILKDLLSYLQNPQEEEARQKSAYKD